VDAPPPIGYPEKKAGTGWAAAPAAGVPQRRKGHAPMTESFDVVIYHNPQCGTSRNTLGLIRNAGIEPHVIDYRKCPPSRVLLADLARRAGTGVRGLLRRKGTPYQDLGLDNPALTDAQLLDAVEAHPILIERPLVVSPRGVRLCRPSERVLDILPPQRGEFFKEDGERVIDERGRQVGLA
jgi:arsenate reductase